MQKWRVKRIIWKSRKLLDLLEQYLETDPFLDDSKWKRRVIDSTLMISNIFDQRIWDSDNIEKIKYKYSSLELKIAWKKMDVKMFSKIIQKRITALWEGDENDLLNRQAFMEEVIRRLKQ